jgi:hypothetical protein
MATLVGPRALPTFPTPSIPVMKGVLGVAWGYYNATAALAQNDIIHFCRVPAGATVIGGYFQAADIDTGTEALDIDIGWAANGAEAVDTDGFGNLGVLDGDVISQFRPVAGIYYPFINIIQTNGYQTFTKETMLTATVNAAANAGGTGMLKLVAHWVSGPIS